MADKKISALTSASTPLAGSEVLPIVQSGATVKVSVDNLTIGKSVQTGALLSGTASAVGQVTSFAAATNNGAENAVAIMRYGTTYGSAIFHNYNSTLNRETVNIAVSDGGASPATNSLTKYRATADGSHYFYGATDSTLQISVSSGNIIPATAAKGINFTANTPAAGMTSQLLNWYEEGTWTPTDGSGAGLSFTVQSAIYTRIGRTVTVNMWLTYPATASVSSATVSGLPFTIRSGNYSPCNVLSNSGTSTAGLFVGGSTNVSINNPLNTNTGITNVTLSGKNIYVSGTYQI
jgi:hypothetical protein